MKNIIIIGAGPAGLTTAYEILKNDNNKNFKVIILEKNDKSGGISRTENYKDNYIDIGGHRFFTKDEEIMNLWKQIMPVETDQNYNTEDLFLIRNRISRIYYNNTFFNYPLSFSFDTLKKMGFLNTFKCGISYLKTFITKKEENNLENFYINKFGKKLYSIFFKDYTTKVWGKTPDNISSDWGAQRVKGVSIKELIINYFSKNKSKETSLIETFYYPKFGPGQFYEKMAKDIQKMGGKIIYNCNITKIKVSDNSIKNLTYIDNKVKNNINVDFLVSSMSIKDLVNAFSSVPKNIKLYSNNLSYRDFITVGVLVDKLLINDLKTNNLISDTWIYIQDNSVKLGRVQIFNNWSPYMVKDKNKVWLGLEYFCSENDDFWNMNDDDIKDYAIKELEKIIFIDIKDVKDSVVIRNLKAYPAYFDGYNNINKIKNYLFKLNNLYCVGRNGQHRYNNMDHSMKTGLICARQILNNIKNNEELWNVNTEKEYHEVKYEKNN